MTEQEKNAEYIKCLNDPRYFYNTYFTINGEPVKPVSEAQWERMNFVFASRRTRGGLINDAINKKAENNSK